MPYAFPAHLELVGDLLQRVDLPIGQSEPLDDHLLLPRVQMLELQQENLLRYPDRKLLMLNIDAGGVQSRKILDRLLAAERAPAATQAVAA